MDFFKWPPSPDKRLEKFILLNPFWLQSWTKYHYVSSHDNHIELKSVQNNIFPNCFCHYHKYPLSTDDNCQMSKQLINIKIDKDQQTGKQPFLIGPISHNLSLSATLLGQMKSKQGSQPRQINHPQINKLQGRGLANDL